MLVPALSVHLLMSDDKHSFASPPYYLTLQLSCVLDRLAHGSPHMVLPNTAGRLQPPLCVQSLIWLDAEITEIGAHLRVLVGADHSDLRVLELGRCLRGMHVNFHAIHIRIGGFAIILESKGV